MAATSDDWMPEDVYMSIKQGNSALFVGEGESGEYLGFLVMRMVHTFHGTNLEIWCAHSATKAPLMRQFMPEIEALAKGAKAQKIVFKSTRPEWASVGKRLGFTPAQVTYEFSL